MSLYCTHGPKLDSADFLLAKKSCINWQAAWKVNSVCQSIGFKHTQMRISVISRDDDVSYKGCLSPFRL